ncbi:MAG: cation transporter [Desulfobacterales bacterium]|nr:cation transporter [Desulfobacterales bacterium]
MADCCNNTVCEIKKLQARQSKTLKVVLGINLGMFFVEFMVGLTVASTALLGDSLDMLGDALVYGFSLYVVSRNDLWKATSAMIKGVIMGVFGLFVFGYAISKFINPVTPQFEAIGLTGLLALIANAICLGLLWYHRTEDVNMRSVWLCSRNDIIANISVMFASFGVWFFNSQLPDIIVGAGIAMLFLYSAGYVFKDSIETYKEARSKIIS